MAKVTKAQMARMTPRQRYLALEEQRLDRLAHRVKKAADLISVAAVWHGDGAEGTARDRLEGAIKALRAADQYLSMRHWQKR